MVLGGRELLLRFLREAYDHIRGNGRAVKPVVQQCYGFQIPGGIVFAVHALEGSVAPALHGQVELRTQLRQRGGAAAEVLRHPLDLKTHDFQN